MVATSRLVTLPAVVVGFSIGLYSVALGANCIYPSCRHAAAIHHTNPDCLGFDPKQCFEGLQALSDMGDDCVPGPETVQARVFNCNGLCSEACDPPLNASREMHPPAAFEGCMDMNVPDYYQDVCDDTY